MAKLKTKPLASTLAFAGLAGVAMADAWKFASGMAKGDVCPSSGILGQMAA